MSGPEENAPWPTSPRVTVRNGWGLGAPGVELARRLCRHVGRALYYAEEELALAERSPDERALEAARFHVAWATFRYRRVCRVLAKAEIVAAAKAAAQGELS